MHITTTAVFHFLSLVLMTFAAVYLHMKQGEMIRARGSRGYVERQPDLEVIKPREFYSPGLLPSPIAPHSSSREGATHGNLEMNQAVRFKVLP